MSGDLFFLCDSAAEIKGRRESERGQDISHLFEK